MPLSGKEDEIRLKVDISLAKHIDWRTKRLERKAYARIAEELNSFGVSDVYVAKLWRKHKQDILDSVNRDLVMSLKRLSGSGGQRKISVVELYEKVKAVPFQYRKNVRTLAFKVGIPNSTIHDALKKGLLKHTHNTIRPILADNNKTDRVGSCSSFVQNGQFTDMLDRVDIDEKWFYMTEVATSYILVPGETPPHRTCKHKSHIEKVMCLTAVARPQQNPMNGEWWDGKIGTGFFVEQIPAKRTSKIDPWERLRQRVSRWTRKSLLRCISIISFQESLLSGQRGGPRRCKSSWITCQPTQSQESWAQRSDMNAGGWDISFVHQPANSPDCNTLNLAFFRTIQSLQYQKCAKNIDELIAHVQEAFTELPLNICHKVWTTAQIVMSHILIHQGNNDYKLPHVGKLKVEKAFGHDIPMRLPCWALIDAEALDYEYIATFMTNGKLIVVLTTRR